MATIELRRGHCRPSLTRLSCTETWEPTIEEMLVELESSKESTLPVEEIWSLDVVNQGDSGVLNETVLGDSCKLFSMLLSGFFWNLHC